MTCHFLGKVSRFLGFCLFIGSYIFSKCHGWREINENVLEIFFHFYNICNFFFVKSWREKTHNLVTRLPFFLKINTFLGLWSEQKDHWVNFKTVGRKLKCWSVEKDWPRCHHQNDWSSHTTSSSSEPKWSYKVLNCHKQSFSSKNDRKWWRNKQKTLTYHGDWGHEGRPSCARLGCSNVRTRWESGISYCLCRAGYRPIPRLVNGPPQRQLTRPETSWGVHRFRNGHLKV